MNYLSKEQREYLIKDITREALKKCNNNWEIEAMKQTLNLMLPFVLLKIETDLENEHKIRCWFEKTL